MRHKWLVLLIVLMMLPLPGQSAKRVSAVGTTLYVAPVGLTTGSCASWATACNLQYALSAAAAGSELWVKQGTYRPTTSTNRAISFVLKYGVALYGGFAGTETALTQRNLALNVTILSGDIGVPNNTSDNSYHVVVAEAGTNNTALDGFTIMGGNANSAPNNKGGGIYNESGWPAPVLTNVIFRGNAATHGGGMYNNYADPVLTNVTFSNNSAASAGGAMYNANSNPTLTSVIFSGNSAIQGGGMLNSSSSPALTNVTFSNNSATTAGGGMYTVGGSSTPVLTNVTFSNNSATYGGGMWTDTAPPTLTNVTFSSNSATQGGGMLNSSNSPALTNVTFSNNSATLGGGIYNLSSNPRLINTIVANSTSGGDCVNNASTLNTASANNLIEGTGPNACGLTNGTRGNIIGQDPNLGALTDNGGFTQTHALNTGSPAINAGTNTGCAPTDQRGVPRPQGATCDIGAFEVSITIGGPDSFGYTYDNTVPYNWISADTNSGLVGDDAFTGPIDIGFTFPFYGVPQTQLYFSTNGLITFGAGNARGGGHGATIPSDLNPNNFIAPFWEGLTARNATIYYSRGGSAPNRYFVVEWRDVFTDYGFGGMGGEFSFEAILYENGDIIVQHQTLLGTYYSTVGIEDSSGYQGLQYQAGTSGLSAPKAIRFYYPTPVARVLAYPLQPGGFVPLGGHSDFSIVVVNQGSLGTDCYDLNSTSTWPVAYYASDGVTLLTDTDGDSLIDTGPLAQSASTTIIARYQAPAGAVVGDSNFSSIQFTSSLNASVSRTVALQMSIPAGFASVFKDYASSSLSFLTASADGTQLSQAISNNSNGYNVAVAQLVNGNYFYVWEKWKSSPIRGPVGDIEYAILNREGQLVRPPGKLTNNPPTQDWYTRDSLPSIAVAPDGTVGVVWHRYRQDQLFYYISDNILFTTLNTDGDLLTGPAFIANGPHLSDPSDLYFPHYYNPTITASSENRFIIGWEHNFPGNYNVWYAVRDTAGGVVQGPAALTGNNISQDPVLNSIAGGKVIVTWL